MNRIEPWSLSTSTTVIVGKEYRSVLTTLMRYSINYEMLIFVLDNFGEFKHLLRLSEKLTPLTMGRINMNPFKPFGERRMFYDALAEIFAYAGQGRYAHSPTVYRIGETLRRYSADEEPTVSSILSDLEMSELPSESGLIEALTPLQDYSLCLRENFAMEKIVERGACVDLSRVSSSYVRSLISLTFMLRLYVLAGHPSLIAVTHPLLIWGSRQEQSTSASVADGLIPEGLNVNGVGLVLACEHPDEVPKFLWRRTGTLLVAGPVDRAGLPQWSLRLSEGQAYDGSSFLITVDGRVHRINFPDLDDYAPLSEDEASKRLKAVLLEAYSVPLPPLLVEQFGDRAQLAIAMLEYVKSHTPSFELASEWAKGKAGQASLDVLGRLVRLQFLRLVEGGEGIRFELTKKGQLVLSVYNGSGEHRS